MRRTKTPSTLPLALVAILAILAPPLATAADDPAPQSPEATVEAFHEALGRGDRDGVLDLLAEDVVIFESGGAELSREQYAHHHLASDMEFAAATRSTVLDRRRGGGDGGAGDEAVVWVLTRSVTSGTFRDHEISAQGTETMLLTRASDGWKIVHIHWSSRDRKD